ncbi:MAG: prepilin-type N-terminal cleavage/methylation protein [Rhodoglobus sp.]|nr:prepilin-type N-terminal cleavage/methylation protein [Rhodoglobus sp.]
MTRFITALNKKRASFNNSDKGFTLIELLVVVIIIGILAAIAIPVYIGVQNNAKNSATVTDLTNAKLAVVAYYSDKGTMPATYDAATLANYGYTTSGGSAPALGSTTPTVTSFCLTATSASNTLYYITSSVAATTTKPTPCT